MKKIKELWPEQELVLVCRRGVGEFFAKTGLVNEVLEIQKGDGESYRGALKKLQHMQIEKIISPHESLRTAFFAWKITAKEKISFAKPWNGLFYGVRVKKNYQLPDAIRQLSILQNHDADLKSKVDTFAAEGKPYAVAADGLLAKTPGWASMNLCGFYDNQRADIEVALAKAHLEKAVANKSVALFPGSVWATKRWKEEGYVQAGQKLSAQGVPVLVMGGPGEEELCARVAKQIPGARDLCAKTSIYESALILSQLAAVIGNDSASMHLAATSGAPSVVIFGPTILEFGFRPWQDHVAVVETQGLACRPCGKHGHNKCPIGTHICMKQISKDEVLEKLRGVLHEA